jgi:hypothetical protein
MTSLYLEIVKLNRAGSLLFQKKILMLNFWGQQGNEGLGVKAPDMLE